MASDGPSAIGVIGSNHTSNEENYLLQKFARLVLRTNNIDHHRTADFPAFASALAGKKDATASMRDVFNTPAILLIGNNPTEQHPLLAWQIRSNVRLHRGKVYTGEFLSHKAAPPGNGICADCFRLGRQLRAVPGRQRCSRRCGRVARSSRAKRCRRCASAERMRKGWSSSSAPSCAATTSLALVNYGLWLGREVHLPGRLRQLARRGRHGPVSRHAARLCSGFQCYPLPPRLGGRNPQHCRASICCRWWTPQKTAS